MSSFADRVRDTTTTTGTGALTLAGAPPTGFRTFASAFATGARVSYAISSASGSEWEVGRGTLTSPTTLARTEVYASSNGNSVVTLSPGTKDVFCTITATRMNDLEPRGRVEMIRTSQVML